MDSIAVIDDRADMRESVASYIKLGLEDLGVDWEVIDREPLGSIEDYSLWVRENEVAVLVLDEKLGDQAGAEGIAVEYSGHDVASLLRRQLPDLPQVIVTSVTISDELENAQELDAVVPRRKFGDHYKVYVDRMVRMGKSYLNRNEIELAEISRLSMRVVRSEATSEDLHRLDALRTKLQAVDRTSDLGTMSDWLDEAAKLGARLEAILTELRGRGRK